jgi:hypothetical protein
MMIGKGEQWEAENWTKLNRHAIKNKRLVDSILNKVRMPNVEFRKVKGHNGDQLNEAVDALAVVGRDEAINWPKCSFDIIMPTGQIPFPVRATRDTMVMSDLCAQLAEETHIKIPFWRDLKVHKDGFYLLRKLGGHSELVHKTLDPQDRRRRAVLNQRKAQLQLALASSTEGDSSLRAPLALSR